MILFRFAIVVSEKNTNHREMARDLVELGVDVEHAAENGIDVLAHEHRLHEYMLSPYPNRRKMTERDLPLLVLVTGPPGGKTTLGEPLARELGLPFFSKDRRVDVARLASRIR